MEARALSGVVKVVDVHCSGNVGYLAVDLEGRAYEAFRRLPAALEFQGRVYGKSAYSSDTMRAYYRTDVPLATEVR
jgi:hypothetical protein